MLIQVTIDTDTQRVVPKDPSQAMCDAASVEMNNPDNIGTFGYPPRMAYQRMYRAMLRKAPQHIQNAARMPDEREIFERYSENRVERLHYEIASQNAWNAWQTCAKLYRPANPSEQLEKLMGLAIDYSVSYRVFFSSGNNDGELQKMVLAQSALRDFAAKLLGIQS